MYARIQGMEASRKRLADSGRISLAEGVRRKIAGYQQELGKRIRERLDRGETIEPKLMEASQCK
jgi:hypothetical protein